MRCLVDGLDERGLCSGWAGSILGCWDGMGWDGYPLGVSVPKLSAFFMEIGPLCCLLFCVFFGVVYLSPKGRMVMG